jgi:hypothetical protein
VRSLAAVLYHLLSGESPYAKLGDAQTLLAIMRGDPIGPPLGNVRPGLDAIMTAALATDREERFDSTQAFAHALANVYPEVASASTLETTMRFLQEIPVHHGEFGTGSRASLPSLSQDAPSSPALVPHLNSDAKPPTPGELLPDPSDDSTVTATQHPVEDPTTAKRTSPDAALSASPSGMPLSASPSGMPLSASPSGMPLSASPSGMPLSASPSAPSAPEAMGVAPEALRLQEAVAALRPFNTLPLPSRQPAVSAQRAAEAQVAAAVNGTLRLAPIETEALRAKAQPTRSDATSAISSKDEFLRWLMLLLLPLALGALLGVIWVLWKR